MSKTESLRSRMQGLEGKRVLVAGFARSGRAAADFFQRRGAVVTVSDSRPPWSFTSEIPDLLARKIGVEFGQHGAETFARQDLVVTSPGVPWDLPALAAAREHGIPVVSEVEAASWFLKGSLVGVTGSNGKTTTTALLGRMLEESGFPTLVGGNIGVPLVSMVEHSTTDSVSVAELSSFQLEGTETMDPQVAVMLNITPNHLDRHPSLESYIEAKARILRNQSDKDYAVFNADDPTVAALAERARGKRVLFSRTKDIPEGLLISEGQVVYRVGHLQRDLFSPLDVRLRGDFNLENVLAASAAACVVGADFNAIAKAVREFRGVEHRLEFAGEVLGVEFYNDSKATSVDATVKALGAFDGGVHLILGGKDKGAPYAPLIPLLKNRVREVLLIGAAAERIGPELAGMIDLVAAGNLETAVRQAFSRALPRDVILLSPACASFDQFQDFEDRGRRFKQLVEGLAQEGHVARLRRSWIQADSRTRATPAEPDPGPVAGTREEVAPPFQLSPLEPARSRTREAGPSLFPGWSQSESADTDRAPMPKLPQQDLAKTASQPEPVHGASPALPTSASRPSDPTLLTTEADFVVPPPDLPTRVERDTGVIAESAGRREVTLPPLEQVGSVEPRPDARPPQPRPALAAPVESTTEERLAGHTSEQPVISRPPDREPDEEPKAAPDRIYVYELDAEERRPMETGDTYAFDDVVLDRGARSGLDLSVDPAPSGREAVNRPDEPLIFEVTAERSPRGSASEATTSETLRGSGGTTELVEEAVRGRGRRGKSRAGAAPKE